MSLAAIVRDIVDAIIGRKLHYLALYPCLVVTQHSDGTVDVMPEDSRVRGLGLQRVMVRDGQTDYTIANDSRVLLGFEAADPGRPYVIPWDSTVDCGRLHVQQAGMMVTLHYLAPGASVWTPLVTSPAPPVLTTDGTAITGVIDGGT